MNLVIVTKYNDFVYLLNLLQKAKLCRWTKCNVLNIDARIVRIIDLLLGQVTKPVYITIVTTSVIDSIAVFICSADVFCFLLYWIFSMEGSNAMLLSFFDE